MRPCLFFTLQNHSGGLLFHRPPCAPAYFHNANPFWRSAFPQTSVRLAYSLQWEIIAEVWWMSGGGLLFDRPPCALHIFCNGLSASEVHWDSGSYNTKYGSHGTSMAQATGSKGLPGTGRRILIRFLSQVPLTPASTLAAKHVGSHRTKPYHQPAPV